MLAADTWIRICSLDVTVRARVNVSDVNALQNRFAINVLSCIDAVPTPLLAANRSVYGVAQRISSDAGSLPPKPIEVNLRFGNAEVGSAVCVG